MSGVSEEEIDLAMSSLRQLKKTDLSKFHTKQLNKMLRLRPCITYEWEIGLLDEPELHRRAEYKRILKEELAKRPHVPNKRESLTKRITAKKRGTSRGRKDK